MSDLNPSASKPDYYSWNASDLFKFLQNNEIIAEKDGFDDWMYDRPRMLELAENFFEQS